MFLQTSFTRISVSALQGKIKTPTYIRPKGRPKHTGTLWPSKQKGTKRLQPSSNDIENVQPQKKAKYSKSNGKLQSHLKTYKVGTPAYRSRVARERKHVLLTGTNNIKIVVSDTLISEKGNDTCNLTDEDLSILQANHKWLNDSLINAGQVLIKEKFPNVKGLQNIMSHTLSFHNEDAVHSGVELC